MSDPVHPPDDITVVDVGVSDHMLVSWTVDIIFTFTEVYHNLQTFLEIV